MGLNRIIPTNIILEAIMISTQVSSLYFDSCSYNNNSEHTTLVTFMVNFFTTTVALFLLISVIWIYYFRMHNYVYTNKKGSSINRKFPSLCWMLDLRQFPPRFSRWICVILFLHGRNTTSIRKMRGIQGLVLILMGALSLGTAQGMWKTEEDGHHCATVFEITIVGGATAILDGILYFLRPTRKGRNIFATDAGPMTGFPPPSNTINEVYVIQHDLPAYEAPPSYGDLNLEQQRGSHSLQGNANPATK